MSLPSRFDPSNRIPSAHTDTNRPELRIITSFPAPPAREPCRLPSRAPIALPLHKDIPQRFTTLPHTSDAIRHPRPIRHPSLIHPSSLPNPKRKPVPPLRVLVDNNNNLTGDDVKDLKSPIIRTSNNLEKRLNREAVVIAREVYTSYQPRPGDTQWGLYNGREMTTPRRTELENDSERDGHRGDISPHMIDPRQRISGRGHKRTLSDKFKALFSPSPPRPTFGQLMHHGEGRLNHVLVSEDPPESQVKERGERAKVFDGSDLPTLSATYPQPVETLHLDQPIPIDPGYTSKERETEADRLGISSPDRPYRSPGTASFLVHRDYDTSGVNHEAVGRRWQRGPWDRKRDTFGVWWSDRAGHGHCDDDGASSSLASGSCVTGTSEEGEADDEMTPSDEEGAQLVLSS